MVGGMFEKREPKSNKLTRKTAQTDILVTIFD
jgi:hypothetical protein